MQINFSVSLKLIRQFQGYTPGDIANALHIPQSVYESYESGEQIPDIRTFENILRFLHVSADELTGCPDFKESGLLRESQSAYHPQELACTVEEYFLLPDCADYELIEGRLFRKSAPSIKHQKLSLLISMELYRYMTENKRRCEVIPAPFCVILDEIRDTVVQPDISVVCDSGKFRDGCCYGPPDLVLEIISPSRPSHDYRTKLHIYDTYHVPEYWIVDPVSERIIVYHLTGDSGPQIVSFSDMAYSYIFDNLALNMGNLLRQHETRFL